MFRDVVEYLEKNDAIIWYFVNEGYLFAWIPVDVEGLIKTSKEIRELVIQKIEEMP